MQQIDRKEFAKIPYFRGDLAGSRIAQVVPLWENGAWTTWIHGPQGLVVMRPIEYAEGEYAAREPARPDDLNLPFAELLWKRATWPEVCHWLTSIIDDVHNLATALAKIDFLWNKREEISGALSLGRFVKNEVEYILTVCRSVLDELHEIVAVLWERVTLSDADAQKRKRPLEKLSRMVFRESKLMSADEIATHRRVPLGLAALYAQAGPFLGTVRQLRDRVVHGGHDAPFVFATPRGFAVAKNDPLFAALPVVKPEYEYSERLVSLRPLLAHLIMTTLYICNGFGDALSKLLPFPEDIAPGYRLFIRTAHGASMIRTQEVCAAVWWADAHQRVHRDR